MLERSVACSDLSALHSYFSTGIVRLMSPLHNRCHLSVWLRAVQNLRGFRRLRLQNGARYGRRQLILSSSARHSVEASSDLRASWSKDHAWLHVISQFCTHV